MAQRLLATMLVVCSIYLSVDVVFAGVMSGKVGADAAVVIEASTGGIIFSQNADKKLPMASTTKIMSALLALEQENIHEYFVVDEKAIMTEGSSMGLVKGDQVSLYTLAGGMLSASGNDAANAAAVRISGSIEKFSELMNERASQIGLVSTNFKNPSGLPDDEHYTTAYELAKLSAYAMANEDFRAISSKQYIQLEYGNPPYKRSLRNHNRLLSSLEGCVGVKTGFTKAAGRCLVTAVERDGIMLICVTLNCPDDWNTHTYLQNEAFKYVKKINYPDIGELNVSVISGEKASVGITKALDAPFAVGINGLTIDLDTKVYLEPFYYAPIKAGESLGYVEYLCNNIVVERQELYAKEDIVAILAEKTAWESVRQWLEDIL